MGWVGVIRFHGDLGGGRAGAEPYGRRHLEALASQDTGHRAACGFREVGQHVSGPLPVPPAEQGLTCFDPDRLNTSSACGDLQRSAPRCAASSAFVAAARSTSASGTSAAFTSAHSGSKLPATTRSRRALRDGVEGAISRGCEGETARGPAARTAPPAGRWQHSARLSRLTHLALVTSLYSATVSVCPGRSSCHCSTGDSAMEPPLRALFASLVINV